MEGAVVVASVFPGDLRLPGVLEEAGRGMVILLAVAVLRACRQRPEARYPHLGLVEVPVAHTPPVVAMVGHGEQMARMEGRAQEVSVAERHVGMASAAQPVLQSRRTVMLSHGFQPVVSLARYNRCTCPAAPSPSPPSDEP